MRLRLRLGDSSAESINLDFDADEYVYTIMPGVKVLDKVYTRCE